MKRLENKIAIVTGSSGGIGKAIALRLAEEGATVVIAARRIELCEHVATTIRERGGQATVIQTDVTDEAQVTRLISDATHVFVKTDMLEFRFWLVNIDRLRRDVHIATPDCQFLRREVFGKIRTEAPVPL